MSEQNVTNSNMSPWFKIFALMIVGGVAKELFAPQWRPAAPVYNQVVQATKDVAADKVADIIEKGTK